jgi:hypothetical protein
MNDRGLAMLAGYAMQVAWRIEMLAGDDAAAERAARRGCEQLDRLGEHAYLSTQSCQLADALFALGRYDESEQWVLRGLELGASDDLATRAGDHTAVSDMIDEAVKHYIRKGATAYVERARRLAATWTGFQR